MQMNLKINELTDGLKVYNNTICDTDGKEYTGEAYLKKYYHGMMNQYKSGVIPRAYERPTGAQLELTYKCNQRCRHCYNKSGECTDKSELSIDEWKKVARELGELGIFQCVLSGGEPTLLGDSLFEIMDILNEYNVKFIVITNGMLINEKNIEKFKKYRYNWFQVSIDGSRPELHDYVRGVNGAWEKAINAANLVKEAGLPLVISHAVVKKNLPYLEEMIDAAYLLGAEKITTGPFSYMGRGILNEEELDLTVEERQQVYAISNRKMHEYKGRMQVAVSSEEVLGLRTKLIEPNGVVLVRPNGDVKIDCVAPFKIGNVRTSSVKDIWNNIGRNVWEHPRLIEYVKSIKSYDDLLKVRPRINVDEDELLVPVKEA